MEHCDAIRSLWDFMQSPNLTKEQIKDKLDSIDGLEWNLVGKEIGKDLDDQNIFSVHKNDPDKICAELTANMGDAGMELEYVKDGATEEGRNLTQIEATNKWFGVPKEGLQAMAADKINELAQKIGTITFRANGYKRDEKGNPVMEKGFVSTTRTRGTYDFRDNGIGQLPDDFTKTLVSIGKSNRQRYHWSTGSYGFGGASSFEKGFCDASFIASKKYESDRIGFTIVLYRKPDPTTKGGQYYYCTINGVIPEVKDENFSHGTLKRHYNANVDDIKQNSPFGKGNTWTLMRWLMPTTRLPFMIKDEIIYPDGPAKKDKKGAADATVAWGLLPFLRKHKDNLKKIAHYDSAELPKIPGIEGKLGISFFLLPLKIYPEGHKKAGKLNVDQQDTYVKKEKPVIFADGGQYRAGMSQNIFSDREISYLKNNLIVILTMENISYESKISAFATNRDGVSKKYEKAIGKEIRKFLVADDVLKEWNIKFQDASFGADISDKVEACDASLVAFMGGVDEGIDTTKQKRGKPKPKPKPLPDMVVVEPPTEFRFARKKPIMLVADRATTITCITNADPSYIDPINSGNNRIDIKVFESTDNKDNTFVGKKFVCSCSVSHATGIFNSDNNSMLVEKGSTCRGDMTNSCPNYVVKLKQSLIDNNVIIPDNEGYKFSDDHLFDSPSAASGIILGRSSNGLNDWTSGALTLKDFIN